MSATTDGPGLQPTEVAPETRKRLPKAVIAVAGAAALATAVPLIYLLRQRASNTVLQASLNSAPRRAALPSGASYRRTPAPSHSVAVEMRPSLGTVAPKVSPIPPADIPAEDNFNGALHSLKAFGLATVMVTFTAAATVAGVRSWMGVQTTQEFAHRMRQIILEKMPVFVERIHRLAEPEASSENQAGISEVDWNWEDAESRLKNAYERDGFSGWAYAALQEIEAESRLERAQRFRAEQAVPSETPSTSNTPQ
ncbi:hypothetical protein HGRIS_010318 [Hohenbuehelia grisea]|uniref:Transmembrane protein n=1 Tax=Hohenbuehelia grisea TaxID=104357 RepID=A0ABR3J5E6_9AGAR